MDTQETLLHIDRNSSESSLPALEGQRSIIRLHLGCGPKLWDGFINCDLPGNWSGKKPDVECDIRTLPFGDDYADEIHSIHVVEHFSRLEVDNILKDWHRVLKPGGKIALECPCLDKITQALQTPEQSERWLRMTLIGIYGEYWKGEAMIHKWCYLYRELAGILARIGFEKISMLEPLYHIKERDMRVVAWKKQ